MDSTLGMAMAAQSPLSSLVVVVVNAILEVFFLCIVGWILAKKGIVDDKAKKDLHTCFLNRADEEVGAQPRGGLCAIDGDSDTTLNKINVSFFTPALLFSKVAFSLSPDKLKDLVIIPIGFCIVTSVSCGVAYLIAGVFRLPKSQRSFAMACGMFQNSNSLPIALIQALIAEKKVLPLAWHPHDTQDEMLGRALSYLVLYSTLGIIIRWSIGVKLLAQAETDEETPQESEAEQTPGQLNESDLDRRLLLGAKNASVNTRARTTSNPSSDVTEHEEDYEGPEIPLSPTKKPAAPRKRPVFPQSFPNTPMVTSASQSELGDDEGDEYGSGRRSIDSLNRWLLLDSYVSPSSNVGSFIHRTARFIYKIWSKISVFMTVPLWAALLSLVVACIPPLQHQLSEFDALKNSIKNAGACSVPITLVTLGAYFYTPPNRAGGDDSLVSEDECAHPVHNSAAAPLISRINYFSKHNRLLRSHNDERHIGKAQAHRLALENRTVAASVLTRMVFVPLVLIPLFGAFAYYTVHNVADDPVFVMTTCLLVGSPTAITLAQITSSASGVQFEKLISRTLFISYAFLTPLSTILLVLSAVYIIDLQA